MRDDKPQLLLARVSELTGELTRTTWSIPLEIMYATPNDLDSDSTNSDKSHKSKMKATLVQNIRRVNLLQSMLTAFTMFIAFSAIGSGWRDIVKDIMVDFSYQRLLFILTVPAHLWLGLVSSET